MLQPVVKVALGDRIDPLDSMLELRRHRLTNNLCLHILAFMSPAAPLETLALVFCLPTVGLGFASGLALPLAQPSAPRAERASQRHRSQYRLTPWPCKSLARQCAAPGRSSTPQRSGQRTLSSIGSVQGSGPSAPPSIITLLASYRPLLSKIPKL